MWHNLWIVHFKLVKCVVYELCLHKIIFFKLELLLLIAKKQMIKRLVDFHTPDHKPVCNQVQLWQ